jgi:hypothetical protein
MKMAPDRDATRGTTASVRLILGGIVVAVIVALVMIMLAGKPDPQRGESLPNAPEATGK